MTDQHQRPITPPTELVKQWTTEGRCQDYCDTIEYVAARAGQWCADQELEACCEVLQQKGVPAWSLLRLNRRPKPPSLKKQALEDFENLMSDLANHGMGFKAANILRALEALPDD